MKDLRDLTFAELEREVERLGEKPFRAGQVYKWVFHKGATSIDQMTDISKTLRETLKKEFCINTPQVKTVKTSKDGTRKFLSVLSDGQAIESVLIPDEGRLTLCVSTQAGCALGCEFCATGEIGAGRDLTLSEMCGEVLAARELLEEDETLTNIVLMGMGEPLLNYENVLRFLDVLTDPKGIAIGKRKVTLSTAGVVPGIERLGRDSEVSLAVSLNATTDEVRDKLMPINRKYPLKVLLKTLAAYPLKRGRRVTIEYILIKGVNDSLEDARRLVKLMRPLKAKLNLIRFNPHPSSPYKPPTEARVREFQKVLLDAKLVCVVRDSRGSDIEAACGQLAGDRQQ